MEVVDYEKLAIYYHLVNLSLLTILAISYKRNNLIKNLTQLNSTSVENISCRSNKTQKVENVESLGIGVRLEEILRIMVCSTLKEDVKPQYGKSKF